MTCNSHTVALVLAGVTAGLGAGLASGRADADTKIVVGYTQSAQSIVGRTVDHFKEKAEELSNGALDVQVFPSSQLGTFGAMVTQMKSGLVNVIFIQPDALGEQVPIATANSWPFLFDNQAEMLEAWNGPGGPQLIDEVEQSSG